MGDGEKWACSHKMMKGKQEPAEAQGRVITRYCCDELAPGTRAEA